MFLDREEMQFWVVLSQNNTCAFCGERLLAFDLHEYPSRAKCKLTPVYFFTTYAVCRDCHSKYQNNVKRNKKMVNYWIPKKLDFIEKRKERLKHMSPIEIEIQKKNGISDEECQWIKELDFEDCLATQIMNNVNQGILIELYKKVFKKDVVTRDFLEKYKVLPKKKKKISKSGFKTNKDCIYKKKLNGKIVKRSNK